MKRLFTPFLLFVLLLVSAQALAESYDLYVAGIQVTDANKDNITGPGISGGKVEYVPSVKQLRIDDGAAILSTSPNKSGIESGIEDLKIIFSGTASIQTTSGGSCAGILCRKSAVIGGWSGSAAPYVNIYCNENAPAILSKDGADIQIIGMRLTATSGTYHAICTENGNNATLTITESKLTAGAIATDRAGITGFGGGIELRGSTLANRQFVSGGTVVDKNGKILNKVITYPHVMIGDVFPNVGGITLTKNNTGAENSASGRATFNHWEKKLWLRDVQLDGVGIVIYAPDITIEVVGTCSLTNGLCPFFVNGNTSLTGDGTLSITSTAQSGVQVEGEYNLSVCLPRFSACGSADSYGLTASSGTLTLNKHSEDCVYKFAGGKANMYVKNLVMNDMDISTANSYWHSFEHYIYNKGAIAKAVDLGNGTWFKPTSQIGYYDLWVAGARVKTNNTQYIYSPNLTGTVTYNPNAKMLTMDNTTIHMNGQAVPENNAIYSEIQDLTINANGTNEWTSDSYCLNIGGTGYPSIRGSGFLKIHSLKSTAINVFGTTNLSLARSGDTMAVIGKSYGFNGGRPDTRLSITKEGDGALYEFEGETANIGNISTLYLGGGVNISTAYHWFNEEKQAVYCKNDVAASYHPYASSATWIRSDIEWSFLPIFIAGTQLYGSSSGDGNISGFWNKYVKEGDISYDLSSQTLKLNNASIDYTKDSFTNDGIIRTNQGTTLNINVQGNNILESATAYSGLWFFDSNVTIRGDGALNVPGGRDDNVYGLFGSSITVKGNVTLDATTRGIGSNSYAKELIVAENAVVKAKQISFLYDLILKGNRGFIAPARAEFSYSNCRVEVDGQLAYDVVIDKVETYDLIIADTEVTSVNCDDILGNGVFSYDVNTNTLTIDGDYTYYDLYDLYDANIFSGIEDLTINVASNSTLTSVSDKFCLVIDLSASTTITGGTLTLECRDQEGNAGRAIGISTQHANYGQTLTFDNAQVVIADGFAYGLVGCDECGLVIKKSDITVNVKVDGVGDGGAIHRWGSIVLEDSWVVEPYPCQIHSYWGVIDGNGEVVGENGEGTVVITSDRSIYDAIPAVGAAEAVPSEVYDLSGRRLGQAGSGVNIIRREDGKVVKELRK